jgi:alpha/beta superfamily hydrolase
VRELDGLELEVAGTRVRETFVEVEQPFGRIFGVIAAPAAPGASPELGLVLVNSGSIRRTGPNRMWVEVARRWAARGVPTLRLDVEGIGDADGEWTKYADTADLYRGDLEDQVMAAVDDLAARGVARRFAVVGLCSGAYWAFHALRRHDRISAGLLLNLFVFFWNADRAEMKDVPRAGRLVSPRFWLRVIRGQANAARIRAFLRWAIRSPTKAWGRMARRRADVGRIDAALTGLREQEKRAVLLLSPEEPLWGHLEADGLLERMDEWPNVELRTIEPVDHTFRALWMQQEVQQALDRAIAEELGRGPTSRLGDAIPSTPPDMAASADRRT